MENPRKQGKQWSVKISRVADEHLQVPLGFITTSVIDLKLIPWWTNPN